MLGYDPRSGKPDTLMLLQPGEVIGWVSHVRDVACETAIASTEVICLNLPATDFLSLMKQESAFAEALQSRISLTELYELLGEELNRRADGNTDLLKLTRTAWETAVVQTFPMGRSSLIPGNGEDRLWLVSGSSHTKFPVGSPVDLNANTKLPLHGNLRLVGVPKYLLPASIIPVTTSTTADSWASDIPYASEIVAKPAISKQSQREKYPYIRARGPIDATLACFQMLSQYFNMPFRRDMLRRVLTKQQENAGSLSLQFCGAVAELMGLTTQIVKIPASAVSRLQPPVMISWQDTFAVIYKTSPQELLIAVPEMGLVRRKSRDFAETWGTEGEVLLLQPTKHTPKSRFGLSWFVPSLRRYRKVLIEVLIASIVVQIFGLVNPLATQVIIDKVIVGNSPDTLEVFGIFLIVVSIVEAILSNVRTHLFVDTTNRIDLSLGSEVINHLLRLPLSYFDRRPVGELATRINELEHIRSFLIGYGFNSSHGCGVFSDLHRCHGYL